MFVDHLQLADFRSYAAVDVALGAGVAVFVGANGQGKTNLVEAVGLPVHARLAPGRRRPAAGPGRRRAGDRPGPGARRGWTTRGSCSSRSRSPRARPTGPGSTAPRCKRPRELLGVLRTVLFAPEDLAVVKGDPSERRRFLDELIVARWPRLAGIRADYDRVLRQRNTLLKSLAGRSRGGGAGADVGGTLDVWDSHLAAAGGELMAARLQTLADLAPHVAKAYADIAPTNNDATVEYKASIDLAALRPAQGTAAREELTELLGATMLERRPDEIQRGVSLVGPHRDDLVLSLGMLPAKGYASHGESWSFALALKLGSFALLRADGVEPVLILDDVFAELDTTRRERLAAGVSGAEQVLVTAAVGADVPEQLQGRRFTVAGGEVTPE